MEEEEKKITCCCCGDDYQVSSMTETESGMVCSSCLENEYCECERCNNYFESGYGYHTEIGVVCNYCKGEYFFSCASCGNLFDVDGDNHHIHNNRTYCTGCYTQNATYRNYDLESKKFIGKKKSVIIKSKRPFGIEIETIYPNRNAITEVSKGLPKEFGVTTDGSLSAKKDGMGGIEIQTPPLSLNKGEKSIKDACKLLKKNKYKVNESCGLHVHLDTAEFKNEDDASQFPYIKNLLLFYLVFDDCLSSILPRGRRNNRYCIRLQDHYHCKEVLDTRNRAELEVLWYRATSGLREVRRRKTCRYSENTRYFGVNFHALLAQNHIEIRYHSGTLNAKKMLYWVALHQAIVDTVISGNIGEQTITDANSIIDTRRKVERMLQLINVKGNLRKYILVRFDKFNRRGNTNEKLVCVE